MTRVIAGPQADGGWPSRRATAPAPPPTGRARACSPPGVPAGAAARRPGRWTCTPAPAPSAWRRCPAGRRTTLLVEADAAAARTLRENVTHARPARRRGAAPAKRSRSSPAPAASRRTTSSSSTRRTPSATTNFARSCSHSAPRAGWRRRLVTVERSTRGGDSAGRRVSSLRARRYGEGTLWYGRAAATYEDAR